ncbi:2-amino-4-hydroxy-6-hydroxymethyldihydropteridine diphosphokinase [Dermabacteraceae bacterium P13147]
MSRAGEFAQDAPLPTDTIQLTGLRAFGRHGVLAEEKREGQDFVCDLTLYLSLAPAARRDDLNLTLNYAEIAQRVHAVIGTGSFDLIETLAQRIAQETLAFSPLLRAVEVSVHKPSAPIPVAFSDVAVRIFRRAKPERAVIALGSNLGDSRALLDDAVSALRKLPGSRLVAVSDWLRSAPVGGIAQPDYLNGVALLDTCLDPYELLAKTAEIENAAGRTREVRWGPRTLDLDIISYGGLELSDPVLTLPHPRAHERDFVLAPWLSLDAAAQLPGRGPVAELREKLITAADTAAEGEEK